MTQLELAEKSQALGIKLDRASIAKIENGLRCVLDYELVVFSTILKIPPARLLSTGFPLPTIIQSIVSEEKSG